MGCTGPGGVHFPGGSRRRPGWVPAPTRVGPSTDPGGLQPFPGGFRAVPGGHIFVKLYTMIRICIAVCIDLYE